MEQKDNKNKKKKKSFFEWWTGYGADGRGVSQRDEIRGFSLKNMFRLYFRRIRQLVSVNLIYILGNFPVFFLFLAVSGNYSNASTAPESGLFSVLYGINTASGGSPSLLPLFGIHGLTSAVYAPTAATYVLYAISSLLIITFPLVSTGCSYLMREIVRNEPVFIMSDFFSAIKKNLKQTLIIGVLDEIMLFACGFAVYSYWINYSSYYIMFYAAVLMSIMYLFIRNYLYLMIVSFDLKLGAVIKNSLIFSLLNFGRNFAALLGSVLLGFVTLMLSALFLPAGLILILIILVSTVSYINMYAMFPKVKELMIGDDEPEEPDDGTPGRAHFDEE